MDIWYPVRGEDEYEQVGLEMGGDVEIEVWVYLGTVSYVSRLLEFAVCLTIELVFSYESAKHRLSFDLQLVCVEVPSRTAISMMANLCHGSIDSNLSCSC